MYSVNGNVKGSIQTYQLALPVESSSRISAFLVPNLCSCLRFWEWKGADSSNRGLGEAICIKFALEGCNVAINYMSSVDRAQALTTKIEKEHGVKVALIQGVSLTMNPRVWGLSMFMAWWKEHDWSREESRSRIHRNLTWKPSTRATTFQSPGVYSRC